MKKLKKHQIELKEELKDSDSKQKRLGKELDIIQAQREKALKIIKGL